jgi:hypothetical protein
MDTIKKVNLVDEVYKKMKEKIVSGDWEAGKQNILHMVFRLVEELVDIR